MPRVTFFVAITDKQKEKEYFFRKIVELDFLPVKNSTVVLSRSDGAGLCTSVNSACCDLSLGMADLAKTTQFSIFLCSISPNSVIEYADWDELKEKYKQLLLENNWQED